MQKNVRLVMLQSLGLILAIIAFVSNKNVEVVNEEPSDVSGKTTQEFVVPLEEDEELDVLLEGPDINEVVVTKVKSPMSTSKVSYMKNIVEEESTGIVGMIPADTEYLMLEESSEEYEEESTEQEEESTEYVEETTEYVEAYAMPMNIITVPSIVMTGPQGGVLQTSEVTMDIDRLMSLFYATYEPTSWDYKNKINTFEVLWDFLVNQQNVSPMNTAAILGNVAIEGNFTLEQGTGDCIRNMEQARNRLWRGLRGYGIVQWTYSSRQEALLKYYEYAYSICPNDWNEVSIIAECCMLIEELKVYGVFDDLSKDTSLEDAVGRVCTSYETYGGVWDQWSRYDGCWHLTQNECSGKERLDYAYAVYNYFMSR